MTQSILIIDDEVVLARNLARALERNDLRVRVATSFGQALQVLDDNPLDLPDLVCVDIRLGDGSGLDIAQQVRLRNPALPLVIMTGQDSIAHRSRAESLNAQAFLSKPFPLSHFRELVTSLMPDDPAITLGNMSYGLGPRVLMYSHDTIGLGHMRRNISIAKELAAEVGNVSVLLLAGCPGGALPDLPDGIDLIKLPSLAKIGRDHWRPSSLRIGADHLRSIRAGLIKQVLQDFRPNIVLVDHEPTGVWNELLEPLKRNSGSDLPTERPKFILGLRDILDQPDVVVKRWRKRRVDELIASSYHSVFVYGSEQIYPSATAYGLASMSGVNTRYCGYVTTRSTHQPKSAPTAISKSRVLVCGGGGRDAYPLMHAALSAIAEIRLNCRPNVIMVAGPLMDPELRESLSRRADELGVRFIRRSDNLPALMSSVDLIVTMGGYNSMVEAVNSGTATLVIPRIGPSAEQRLRAELFSRLGLVTTISMESNLTEELRLKFQGLTSTPVSCPRQTDEIQFDGAKNAASAIARLFDAEQITDESIADGVINA